MTLQETMDQLKDLGHEEVRQRNARNGASENQFGVKMGDLRTLAKRIKNDHDLALELWATGNRDAMLLATLSMQPKRLAPEALERMVAAATFTALADWLNAYVVKPHLHKEALRQRWMLSQDAWIARAGWSLTADRVAKDPEGLDLDALLDRIEREMGDAPPPTQWTMNACLAAIGIHFPDRRDRAVAIGEALGVFRDYPTSKGCTSPFAPLWIAEMVRRQG